MTREISHIWVSSRRDWYLLSRSFYWRCWCLVPRKKAAYVTWHLASTQPCSPRTLLSSENLITIYSYIYVAQGIVILCGISLLLEVLYCVETLRRLNCMFTKLNPRNVCFDNYDTFWLLHIWFTSPGHFKSAMIVFHDSCHIQADTLTFLRGHQAVNQISDS